MGIYRCNYCGTLAEYAYMPGMQQIPCVQCRQPVTVLDTVGFVKRLLTRYVQQQQQLKQQIQQSKLMQQELKQLEDIFFASSAGDFYDSDFIAISCPPASYERLSPLMFSLMKPLCITGTMGYIHCFPIDICLGFMRTRVVF